MKDIDPAIRHSWPGQTLALTTSVSPSTTRSTCAGTGPGNVSTASAVEAKKPRTGLRNRKSQVKGWKESPIILTLLVIACAGLFHGRSGLPEYGRMKIALNQRKKLCHSW